MSQSNHPNQHTFPVSRRSFLGAAAAGMGLVATDMSTLNVLRNPVLASELKRSDKRVILLWLAGGASQLETFDPKPGRPTGGPYRAIPTAEPGIHISELMPQVAQRIQHTAIIRSLDTRIADHGTAADLMHLGRRDEPSLRYPDLGAMLARELGRADSQVPDYVNFYTATEGRGNAISQSGFLGTRYNAMFLTEQNTPANLRRLDEITELDHRERSDLRNLLAARFERGRESAPLASHNEAYARVKGLMASEKLFDISSESQRTRDRYGPTLVRRAGAHRPPAGRRGSPVCQSLTRLVGQSRSEFRDPFGAGHGTRPGAVRAGRRSPGARALGTHADRDPVRVRSDATNQRQPGARPLCIGMERLADGLRHSRRYRLWRQ